MKSFRRSLFFTSAAAVALAMPAKADLILDWNTQAVNAIQNNGEDVATASRELAMLSTAIYDAVNGIDGGFTPYLAGNVGGPSGASMEAAAAAAAKTVMEALYPALGSSFTTLYADQLSTISNGQAKTDGINWGNQVASSILNARASDGASDAVLHVDPTPGGTSYSPPGTVGGWGQTPPLYDLPKLPGWGNVLPFGIAQGNPYRPVTSLDLTSAGYASSYNQVKDLGSATSSTRTVDQTTAAYTFADAAGTPTAAGRWNQIAVKLIQGNGTIDLRTQARILATLNIAAADATISAYDSSFVNNNWRPITAVAYAGIDNNPDTSDDPNWLPLVNTPSMPSYVNINSAIASLGRILLIKYFGDHGVSVQVDTDGDGIADTTKTYSSLTELQNDASMASIWGGTDFSYAVDAGTDVGSQIGNFDFNTYFQAVVVPEPSSLLLAVGALAMLRRRRRQNA